MGVSIAKTVDGEFQLGLLLSPEERDLMVGKHPFGEHGAWGFLQTITTGAYFVAPDPVYEGPKIEANDDGGWFLKWKGDKKAFGLDEGSRHASINETPMYTFARAPVLCVMLGSKIVPTGKHKARRSKKGD